MRTWLVGIPLLVAGCGARDAPDPGNPPGAEAAVADSLVLTAPGGVTVWLAEGRRATDSAGVSCLERTLEIRRPDGVVKVPLLYTISSPALLNDSTIRAELANNCRPGDVYRVDLRTGRPTPDRP